ncbi:nucleoside hydrolase [Rhizobium sp. VS19-DR104.2]|uniref:nucleoside hydrolase n=1 Tax=unclassified Rhizobium TaxID=2613769 RepID=UPI001CC3D8D1|nr:MULTISPECIES: nucleoside hydrolase [unclassified Rhizobium]MBZ5762220.1 nucleoside hydrolase [Rhizobium sp. VS19-DR96]MBZ5768236.1 nucleoside hydrolase [Rhizobium sp. VS19-DR129.2]MBZ5775892.1 nucleoside hydrolase [Rhizobium sp. VS19-DRK62.2]MBZ5787087.1 nucleoside hydrolase [Rhizobium sp. VS19-DR121]MBZ5804161.1 nucleoside hydrolase [Rhizobium sp. VS19-DR181]
MERRKIIIDVDTGTDDAVAIMLAATHRELELVAVTTVNGNVPLEQTTDNTLRVLEWIGRQDIPVYAGMSKPIAREDFPTPRALKRDTKVHMPVLTLPEATGKKQSLSAPQFLVNAFSSDPTMTLVAVAPLSNIAAAIAMDPCFASNVSELMIMGGGVFRPNMTAAAEFNVWADPEAAAVVFSAGFKKITMIPLDATHQATITEDECAKLRALGTPSGRAAADFIEFRINAYKVNAAGGPVPDGAPVHDALCIAALIDRSVIETRHLNVVVETKGEFTVGCTVVDHLKITKREPNCDVAFDADKEKFFEFMHSTFSQAATR